MVQAGQGDDERQLIESAQRDRRAFAQLYRQHYPAVARYVHRRVGDPHLVEDLVADVFLNAMKALPRYRHRGVPVRAWFFRIAGNVVNRWARRQRRWALKSLEEELAAVDHGSSDDRGEVRRARLAMLTLAPKYQNVLVLHHLEGLPIEMVARIVGCRVGTVKSRLSRGRHALREQLSKERSCHAQEF